MSAREIHADDRLTDWGAAAFVAEGARVLGDVALGEDSSLWYGVVARGDVERIRVGPRTNIQDNSVLHADPGYPCELGEGVTVGHGCIVHGARIAAHLGYRDELEALSARCDKFSYLPSLTRQDAEGVLFGRINVAIEDGRLERATGCQLSPDTTHVMLCGNPDMVTSVREVLEAKGMTKHRRRKPGLITTEAYW